MLSSSGTANDPSRVVNVGSVMGEIPIGDGAYSYATSKSAVHQMTRILAKEMSKLHITVNAIARFRPFQSGMTKFAIGDQRGSERVAKRVPHSALAVQKTLLPASSFFVVMADLMSRALSFCLEGSMLLLDPPFLERIDYGNTLCRRFPRKNREIDRNIKVVCHAPKPH